MDTNDIVEPTTENEISTAELATLCRQRAANYNLMSRLCRVEVDADLLKELHERLYPISADDEEINESSRLIAGYLSNISEGTVEELAEDYTATFIGHGSDGHSAAYPYESTYTAPKRLLMQGARTEVLAIYRSQGLDKQDSWRNSEDHISVELEFMERLCIRTANALTAEADDAVETLLATQQNFLKNHLVAWVPMMAVEMRRFAKTDFYRGLSHMLVGYLRTDLDLVDQLVTPAETDEAPAELAGGETTENAASSFELTYSEDLSDNFFDEEE